MGTITIKANGVGVEAQGRVEPQFVPDVGAMNLHGARADPEFVGRVLAGIAMSHEKDDFQFPIRELFAGWILSAWLMVMCQGPERLVERAGAQEDFPIENRFKGGYEQTHRLRLVEKAQGTGLEASRGIKVLGERGVHEDLEIRVEGLDILDELQSALSRKMDLDNQQVRFFGGEFPKGFLGRSARPDNVRAARLSKLHGKAHPAGGMTIHDRNPREDGSGFF